MQAGAAYFTGVGREAVGLPVASLQPPILGVGRYGGIRTAPTHQPNNCEKKNPPVSTGLQAMISGVPKELPDMVGWVTQLSQWRL